MAGDIRFKLVARRAGGVYTCAKVGAFAVAVAVAVDIDVDIVVGAAL